MKQVLAFLNRDVNENYESAPSKALFHRRHLLGQLKPGPTRDLIEELMNTSRAKDYLDQRRFSVSENHVPLHTYSLTDHQLWEAVESRIRVADLETLAKVSLGEHNKIHDQTNT